jgi:hypothetical protein
MPAAARTKPASPRRRPARTALSRENSRALEWAEKMWAEADKVDDSAGFEWMRSAMEAERKATGWGK